MIETAMGSAQTWECDAMGHMNVQFYVARATDGLAALGLALGFGAPRDGLGLVAEDHHIRYLREVRPGVCLTVWGGVLAIEGDSLRAYQEIRNTASGLVQATFIIEAGLYDLASRTRRPLPAGAREAAKRLLVELPDHGAPRGLARTPPRPTPTWDEADRLGLPLTAQGVVGMADCDQHGFMVTRGNMGRVADGLPNLIAKTRGIDRSEDDGYGSAALEYRFVFRSAPRAGDLLALRSGLKGIGAKTVNWVQWLFDRASGQAVATAESINVNFDLVRRKSMPIGDEQRRALARHIVPGLSL
ncbi:MAG TPA: thioesterase family protein [Candidatus Sulfotelmatobacter sp.]|nr:thioesterase family protein [Candidatus Sulfotelmatobacter sp.]